MIRGREVFGLVFLLPFLLAACAAPVSVDRIDPRTVHRELTANVLTVGEERGASRIDLDQEMRLTFSTVKSGVCSSARRLVRSRHRETVMIRVGLIKA